MLQRFKADLHIHTCLSPCADWNMSPQKIIRQSLDNGLDMIAICDHNSSENAEAVMRLGKTMGIQVLPGMEICSREEVHILALFADIEPAIAMQEYIYAHLSGENQPKVFGYQVVADENDEVIKENSKLLIGATQLGLDEIAAKISAIGGKSIASHVDRPAFGLIGQLGFIPKPVLLDGVEVSFRVPLSDARRLIPQINDLPCVTSSDAHFLDDIGRAWTPLLLNTPSFQELCLALQNQDGRKIDS